MAEFAEDEADEREVATAMDAADTVDKRKRSPAQEEALSAVTQVSIEPSPPAVQPAPRNSPDSSTTKGNSAKQTRARKPDKNKHIEHQGRLCAVPTGLTVKPASLNGSFQKVARGVVQHIPDTQASQDARPTRPDPPSTQIDGEVEASAPAPGAPGEHQAEEGAKPSGGPN